MSEQVGAADARVLRVIVNADDFGLSESVNRGIIEGFEAGVVTSASLLVCAPAFDHALELARDHPDLDLGVHLCLDEELPVLPRERVSSLVGEDGRFLPRGALLKRLLITNEIDLGEVRAEWQAQIERCVDAGVRLSHFDGHGHSHVYPRLAAVAIDLARQFGIQACRVPYESMRFVGRDFRLQSYLNKSIVALFSRLTRKQFRAAGIVVPDRFYGMMYGGRLSADRLRGLLEILPPGKVVEIMCHPGLYNADELAPYRHWGYDWQGELEALRANADRFGAEGRIQGISFQELVTLSKHSDDMGAYWDAAVLEWEKTSYSEEERAASDASVSILERLAGLLRAHIRERQVSCLKHVAPHVEGRVCVELGAATGSTCFALLEMGAARVIGLDISERAVANARREAERRGLDPARIEFHRFAAGEELPFAADSAIDIALGLGIAEYIEPSVFRDYVKQIGAESIFFSFDERRVNLQKIIHFFYRGLKRIPYYKMYGQQEIRALLEGVCRGTLRTFREGQNAFVTDLPVTPTREVDAPR